MTTTPEQAVIQATDDPLARVWSRLEAEANSNTDDETALCGMIGVRDGFSEAIQLLDQMTGGDGEYRFSTDPERSCPTPVEMGHRIVERLTHSEKIGWSHERYKVERILAHSQPASEGQLVYETLRELRDSAKEVMALLQRSPTMQGREHVGIGSRFVNAIAAAGMMLEAQPLTEPQRLGQEGEALAEIANWLRTIAPAFQPSMNSKAALEFAANRIERWHFAASLSTPQAEPVADEVAREDREAHLSPAAKAILHDLRDRRLLKWLFAAHADEHPHPIGYVDGPIDLATQHECVETWATLACAHPPAPPQDREAVVEALRPFAELANVILAEAPANAEEIALFTDCQGKVHTVTMDQLRALPLLAEERGERS